MKKLFIVLVVFCLMLVNVYSQDDISKALVLKIDGVITGYTHKYISNALDKAEKENAALVIELDTPGGLLGATRKIVQIILESDIPVITHVAPQGARAGSAGTFIVLASHYASMADGSNIGAAHPVNITGEDLEGNMSEKVLNDTVAFIRSISEKRNRNGDIAEKMVTESISLTSSQALEKNIIDSVDNSVEEVLESARKELGLGNNIAMERIEPSTMQKIAFFLSDPNILVLLLMIGVLAIILEFQMPGTFIFASLGAVAIILFLFGINIIPINYLSLLLVLLGVTLLILEIFIPSFGLFTLASIVSLVFGLYLLFDRENSVGIGVSMWVIIAIVFVVIALAVIIGRLVIKDFKRKPSAGMEKLKGMEGKVIEFSDGEGKMFVNGEIWNITSDDTLVKGEKAVVEDYNGITLTVKKGG